MIPCLTSKHYFVAWTVLTQIIKRFEENIEIVPIQYALVWMTLLFPLARWWVGKWGFPTCGIFVKYLRFRDFEGDSVTPLQAYLLTRWRVLSELTFNKSFMINDSDTIWQWQNGNSNSFSSGNDGWRWWWWWVDDDVVDRSIFESVYNWDYLVVDFCLNSGVSFSIAFGLLIFFKCLRIEDKFCFFFFANSI